MDIVIIVGGQLGDLEFSHKVASCANYIICCDSGADHALKMGITPHLLVGDMDSISDSAAMAFKGIPAKKYNPEKDKTDLSLAIEIAISKKPANISILASFGGDRLDHVLGNIHALLPAAKLGIEAQMLSNNIKATIINNYAKLARAGFSYISLIPMGNVATGISTVGLKYPIDNGSLHMGTTLGISNEFIEDFAEIHVKEGILLAICTK